MVVFSLVSKSETSVQLFCCGLCVIYNKWCLASMDDRLTFKEECVEKTKMEKFKTLLLQAKVKIVNGGIRSNDDLTVSPDDLSDEADLATSVINQQVTFNMRQRELVKLKAIEEALYRIEQGIYGHCEECDEGIGEKRLENQPWTTLCITHAEEQERENLKFTKAV